MPETFKPSPFPGWAASEEECLAQGWIKVRNDKGVTVSRIFHEMGAAQECFERGLTPAQAHVMTDEELKTLGWVRNDKGGIMRVGFEEHIAKLRIVSQARLAQRTVAGQEKAAAAVVKPTGGCVGACQERTLLQKLVFLGEAAVDLAKYVVGERAEEELVYRRQSLCMLCTDVDSEGRRLFRTWSGEGKANTCGVFRPKKLLRDPAVDGCGCLLQLKWKGKDQKCPKGKW